MNWLSWLLVFLGVAAVDVAWTVYIQHASEGNAVRAGLASVSTILLGGFVVLEYTKDPVLLIPASIGAFVGTWLPIAWKARRAKQ